MSQLQTALTDVNAAVNKTKQITDSAFSDIKPANEKSEEKTAE